MEELRSRSNNWGHTPDATECFEEITSNVNKFPGKKTVYNVPFTLISYTQQVPSRFIYKLSQKRGVHFESSCIVHSICIFCLYGFADIAERNVNKPFRTERCTVLCERLLNNNYNARLNVFLLLFIFIFYESWPGGIQWDCRGGEKITTTTTTTMRAFGNDVHTRIRRYCDTVLQYNVNPIESQSNINLKLIRKWLLNYEQPVAFTRYEFTIIYWAKTGIEVE